MVKPPLPTKLERITRGIALGFVAAACTAPVPPSTPRASELRAEIMIEPVRLPATIFIFSIEVMKTMTTDGATAAAEITRAVRTCLHRSFTESITVGVPGLADLMEIERCTQLDENCVAAIVASLGDDFVFWGTVEASSPMIGVKLNLESRQAGHVSDFGFVQDAKHGARSWTELVDRGCRELVTNANLSPGPLAVIVDGKSEGAVSIGGEPRALVGGRLSVEGLARGKHHVVIQISDQEPVHVDVMLEPLTRTTIAVRKDY